MNIYDVIEHASLADTIRLKLAHEAVQEIAADMEAAISTVRTLPVPTSPTIPSGPRCDT